MAEHAPDRRRRGILKGVRIIDATTAVIVAHAACQRHSTSPPQPTAVLSNLIGIVRLSQVEMANNDTHLSRRSLNAEFESVATAFACARLQ